MGIVIAAISILLVLGVIENRLHQRALEKIPLRILVNGTRGKTTVTRMTAAMLCEAGIRTCAKTTGSEARVILPDGSERPYRKRDRVSMMEQLPFVRMAVRGGAQAIVVECMAQRVENQRLMADKLIRPHYVLMTNAFVDHVEEIGATEEETVRVLAQSVPEDSCLIAQDARFDGLAKRTIRPEGEVDVSLLRDCPYTVHEQNARLVLALAEELGIERETAYRGICGAKPDIGMVPKVHWGRCTVWNAFAANDPVSFAGVMEACAREGKYVLLFNHRADRAYRLEAFARAIERGEAKPERIGVMGEDRRWCAGYLARMTGVRAEAVDQAYTWIQALRDAADADCAVLCAGNIKGEGRLLMEKLMKEADMHV